MKKDNISFLREVEFKNWGPFDYAKITPYAGVPNFIIGLNDVGKSAILEGISSLKTGLGTSYTRDNSDHGFQVESLGKSSVKTTLQIKEEFYKQFEAFDKTNKGFSESWIQVFAELFTQEVVVTINQTASMKNFNFEIFQNSPQLHQYLQEKVLPFINKLLAQVPKKFEALQLDDLRDEKLNEMIKIFAKVEQEKDYYGRIENQHELNEYARNKGLYLKIVQVLEVVKNFKLFLLFVFTKKIKFLKTWEENEFDFLISKHNLSDSGENVNKSNGVRVGNIKTAARFLAAFLSKESPAEIEEKLNRIIKTDSTHEWKQNRIHSFGDKVQEKLNLFLQQYFPQKDELKVKLAFNPDEYSGDYKLRITITDLFSDDGHSYLELENRSEGFRWFLKLCVIISNLKPYDIVLIDEPEKFLHLNTLTKLSQLIMKKIQNNKNVFILTTHSPHTIAFDNQIKDWFSLDNLWFVDKNHGISSIKKIDTLRYEKQNDLFKIVYEALGFNLYNLPFSGKKKVVFIEGIADLYTIKAAQIVAQEEEQEASYYLWPLWGNTINSNVAVARMLGLNFKLFLDGSREEFRKKNPKCDLEKRYFVFLGDKMRDWNVSHPEDLLSKESLKHLETKYGGGAHSTFWKSIFQELKNGKQSVLSETETIKLKIYYGVFRNILVNS